MLSKYALLRGMSPEYSYNGVNAATYKGWETGARKIRLEQAVKIADFLGFSLDEMAGRYEFMNRYADPR